MNVPVRQMSHAIALLKERERLSHSRFAGQVVSSQDWNRVEYARIEALIDKLPVDIKRAAEVAVRLTGTTTPDDRPFDIRNVC